jgi:hypothetical protein
MAVGVGPAGDQAMATQRANHPTVVRRQRTHSRRHDSLCVDVAFHYINDDGLHASTIVKPSPNASVPEFLHIIKLNLARKRGTSRTACARRCSG